MASRSLTEKPTSVAPSSFSLPPVSLPPAAGRSRWSSVRARAGIRIWSVPSGSGPVPGQVPQGQPIRVGGHQSGPRPFGRHQDTGQQGSGVVIRRGPDHLAQRLGQAGRRQLHLIGPRIGEDGEILDGEGPHHEPRPGRRNLDLVLAPLERHRPGFEGPDDVGRQTGRGDHRAVVEADRLALDPDGQIEVRPHHGEPVPGHVDPDPRESRRRRAAGGHGSSGGRQRLNQGVAFTTELHTGPLAL